MTVRITMIIKRHENIFGVWLRVLYAVVHEAVRLQP